MNRAMVIVIVFAICGPVGAQDLTVTASAGVAEIELSGQWLQAVSGRAVPSGSTLATWRDAILEVGGEGVRARLEELSLLRVASAGVEDGAPLRLELVTGQVDLAAVGRAIELVVPRATLDLVDGRLRASRDEVELVEGSVAIVYEGGGERVVEAPARFGLADYGVVPILGP